MSRARPEKLFRASSASIKTGKKPNLGVSVASVSTKDASQEACQQVDADLTRALKQIFEVRNCKLNNSNGNNNSSSNNTNSNTKIIVNSNPINSSSNNSEESCVTLFGRKLLGSPTSTTSSSQDGSDSKNAVLGHQYSRQGNDKLPPAATAHLLKELHKQRLKQRGITATANDFPELGEIEFVHTERRPEVSTLPLLNNLQEKRPPLAQLEDLPEPKRQRIERDQGLDLTLSMEFGSPDEQVLTTDANVKDMEIVEKRCGAPAKNPEQLTLFYNGQVLVYDDVPSDKAKAIMVLASSISSKTSCISPVDAASAAPSAIKSIAKAASLPSVKSDPASIYPKKDKEKRPSSDVPQARKASIQRFLEKRKDRLNPKPVAATSECEKGDGSSSKSPSKERPPRSRSPSPPFGCSKPKHSSPATPPRTPSRCGGVVAEDKQCAASLTEAQQHGTAAATTARQWIGV